MNLKEYKNFFKNKNNQFIFIILIIGIVLIFLSGIGDNTSPTSDSSTLSEEKRLETILSDISGVGDVSVMITYHNTAKQNDEKNKAKGAVVTADGCFNPSIKSALSEAVCAALDLPAHKVCVYLKK